ncbi:MAG: reverse transcriptase family protein [Planctomycetota bacterium]
MAFFAWLFRWLGWSTDPRDSWDAPAPPQAADRSAVRTATREAPPRAPDRPPSEPLPRPRLTPTRRDTTRHDARKSRATFVEVTGAVPYKYARFGSGTGRHLDLSQDGDEARLQQRGLPVFRTPEQLADWLGVPLKKVAWLVHRFSAGRPASVEQAHYHFRWLKKKSGGWRLIESPKQTLKQAQVKILREILDRVPTHSAAHGFVQGRSILTNAKPHVGHATLVKLDLSNFYATVGFSRIVALFRALGYSREAAIWLGLLTTSAIPGNMAFPARDPYAFEPYLRRHLPQGAPTSPALANLSAYRLDLRLAGLSKSFGATYTRYADDLAISGPKELAGGLRVLIPLVQQIIRRERFRANSAKRRVLRAHQRQTIAGVVVNAKPNVAREHYDRLKATLTNCVRLGPSTQNREKVADFTSHLRGRIAHVQQLNRARGEKLMVLFNRIDWRR